MTSFSYSFWFFRDVAEFVVIMGYSFFPVRKFSAGFGACFINTTAHVFALEDAFTIYDYCLEVKS